MKRALLAVLLLLVSAAQAQSGPTYQYVVTAVDANGLESVFSNQATATFAQGQHIVTLSWTAPTVAAGGAAIAGYNVYRGTVSGGPYVQINAALVTGTTYSDSFVPPPAPSGLTAKQS